jgi:hypothetical protein
MLERGDIALLLCWATQSQVLETEGRDNIGLKLFPVVDFSHAFHQFRQHPVR